jgi:hypothetical protein
MPRWLHRREPGSEIHQPPRRRRHAAPGFFFWGKITKIGVFLTTHLGPNAVACKGYPFDPNGALARRDTKLASNRHRIRGGIQPTPWGELLPGRGSLSSGSSTGDHR